MPSRLAIIGVYPPPYGGVAVHTRRLLALLERRGIDACVYNAISHTERPPRVVSVFARRRRWLLRYLATGEEPAVYVLSGRLGVWVLSALMGRLRGRRVAIRLRNDDMLQWSRRRRTRVWVQAALRSAEAVVCVNPTLADRCVALGVDPDRVFWFPGFLPPSDDDTDAGGVSADLWAFVDGRSPVLVANGKVAWKRGRDLYGLDLLVELVARLVPDFPDLALVICFWRHNPEDQERVDALRERARALGVAEHIRFNLESGPLVPVLDRADVFLRPTSSDGDASSVREALSLGVPTVASDVAPRPDGVLLHPDADLDALEAQARVALARGRQPPPPPEGDARIAAYLALIEALASGDDVRRVAGWPYRRGAPQP